jgi:hypothetical protein
MVPSRVTTSGAAAAVVGGRRVVGATPHKCGNKEGHRNERHYELSNPPWGEHIGHPFRVRPEGSLSFCEDSTTRQLERPNRNVRPHTRP